MIGEKMTVTKNISELGKATRFGPDWPGERCGAKTRRGTDCQRPAYKHNGRCGLHGGMSTGASTPEGLRRISQTHLKHGRYTNDERKKKRQIAQNNRKIRLELMQIEQLLIQRGYLKN